VRLVLLVQGRFRRRTPPFHDKSAVGPLTRDVGRSLTETPNTSPLDARPYGIGHMHMIPPSLFFCFHTHTYRPTSCRQPCSGRMTSPRRAHAWCAGCRRGASCVAAQVEDASSHAAAAALFRKKVVFLMPRDALVATCETQFPTITPEISVHRGKGLYRRVSG
jgi:hypothetical protein